VVIWKLGGFGVGDWWGGWLVCLRFLVGFLGGAVSDGG